jgi:hypothetical protein
VRCLVYIDELNIERDSRREEKSPKRGWTCCGERMSPSCSGSSRPGIPAERDRQTIRDLHVAIKRRNPLKVGGGGMFLWRDNVAK